VAVPEDRLMMMRITPEHVLIGLNLLGVALLLSAAVLGWIG
jgi:hypothetical protein